MPELDRSTAAYEARIEYVRKVGHTKSLAELALELGVTKRRVSGYRKRAGIAKRPTFADLDPQEDRIAHARRLVAMGQNASTIARNCNLQHKTVRELFPESVWSREQMNEAAGLLLVLRKTDFPRPRYLEGAA